MDVSYYIIHDRRTSKKEEKPIEIKLYLKGQTPRFINTGIKVSVAHWNDASKKVVKHDRASELNAYLAKILASFREQELRMKLDGAIDLKQFTKPSQSAEVTPGSFGQLWAAHLHKAKSTNSWLPDVIERSARSLQLITEFRPHIPFNKVDAFLVEELEEHLEKYTLPGGRFLTKRQRHQIMSDFWYIYRVAVDRKLVTVYFDQFWEATVWDEESNHIIKPDSATRYRTGLNRLRNFRSNIPMAEVNKELLIAYEHYLDSVISDDGTPLRDTWKKKLIGHFRKYYYKAIREGYIDASQDLFRYSGYKNKYAKAKHQNRTALKLHEVRSLMELEIPGHKPGWIRVRDAFVFECMTGLAFNELMQIYPSSIRQAPGGKVYYMYPRQKTDSPIELPLHALWEGKPWQILAPYLTEEGPAWSMSNQKFNDKLKLVAQAAGLQDWRKITSHVGRHSCATILLNMGMEIHMVQKILAHNDIKTTQIYAKMETESVDRELSGLDWGMKD